MKRTPLILIAVIGGVILLGLGFYSGLNYAQRQIEKAKTESPLANLLKSKIIKGLNPTALGKITSISGRNLTLEDGLTVSINENAAIYRLLPATGEAAGAPQPVEKKEIEFGEIKVGDLVSVSCELKVDGSLGCGSITILSAGAIQGGGVGGGGGGGSTGK